MGINPIKENKMSNCSERFPNYKKEAIVKALGLDKSESVKLYKKNNDGSIVEYIIHDVKWTKLCGVRVKRRRHDKAIVEKRSVIIRPRSFGNFYLSSDKNFTLAILEVMKEGEIGGGQ
ncbi:hypothetical protein [Halobacteriovorax sp. ZH2_bin.1]|uniref:hypothetical protein n=1 Tax=unclassified Halobacteriovorax TaxID=2639665 RepID=UPI0037188D37